MIEKAPTVKKTPETLSLLFREDIKEILDKVNTEYLYWDKAKYHVPTDENAEDFWSAIKLSRSIQYQELDLLCCKIKYYQTPFIQEALHEFDTKFENLTSVNSYFSNKDKNYYSNSSIMEEAIASSQMEGAVTTRKEAKEMLITQRKPTDHSQRMILNNYNTINFLIKNTDQNLSTQLILDVHKLITNNTLNSSETEGRFRVNDKIVVQDSITGETVHYPITSSLIVSSIQSLCTFINEKNKVHPVIKALILHFMIAYIHPFVDGNGRTARSLFYWYMIKSGYHLTEYLSISRIIYKSKAQYERAFLYTEHDEMDLNYFIIYNLNVIKKALAELQNYVKAKSKEEDALLELGINGVNERQAQIIKFVTEHSNKIIYVRELEKTLNVSVKTIRSDLKGLVELGLLEIIPVNKRLRGYVKSKNFQLKLKEITAK